MGDVNEECFKGGDSVEDIVFNSLPINGPLRITSLFGKRDTGISGASTYHNGVDLGRDLSKPETRVLSVKDGIVSANFGMIYADGW